MTNIAKNLENFIEKYVKLSESEKFAIGNIFREKTGGKLSPYNSPQPVAVAVIAVKTKDGVKVLAGRRAIAPKIGELALPGGFFNTKEHGREAVAREVLEEVGLDLDPEKFSMHHFPLTSPTNNVLIFFKYDEVLPESVLEKIVLASEKEGSREMNEFVLIDTTNILAFPYHEQAVKTYFETYVNSYKNLSIS